MFRLSKWFMSPAQAPAAGAFVFLDPGPLEDGDLRLLAPEPRWAEEMIRSCSHPLTRQFEAEQASITRDSVLKFLAAAPAGHELPDAHTGKAPCYHFWMHVDGFARPPLAVVGDITLRVGDGQEVELYSGHIGYHVFPAARGHHYAERACRLLLPLARRHGIKPLWITTDPANAASRRTCERLGGIMVEIVDVPEGHVLHSRGQKRKCRYKIDL